MPKRIPGGRVEKEASYRKTLLLKALKKHRCLISFACQAAHIPSSTYYLYLEQDPEFAKAVQELREGVLDWAESKLQKSMEEGEYIPTMFYLKCQGKKRGYIEKQEVRISGDKDNPIVPDSIVQSVLQAVIQAEKDKLAQTPVEEG